MQSFEFACTRQREWNGNSLPLQRRRTSVPLEVLRCSCDVTRRQLHIDFLENVRIGLGLREVDGSLCIDPAVVKTMSGVQLAKSIISLSDSFGDL